jgi:hypothetical protein
MMIRRLELMLGGPHSSALNQEAFTSPQQLHGTPYEEHLKETSFNTGLKQMTSSSGLSGSSFNSGQSMPFDNHYFHQSRKGSNKYANPTRSIHEAVETTQSSREPADRCKPTQVNCKTSPEGLANLSIVEPKGRSLLRRLFSNAPVKPHSHEITVPANRGAHLPKALNSHARMTPPSRRTTLPPPYVAAVPFGGRELDLE